MDHHVTIATASDLIDLASLADEFRQQLGQDEPTRADFARSFERLIAEGATEFHIALSRFYTKQYRRVGLNTNERNLAALAFYERFGFRAERFAWQGGRQLWLERDLNSERSL